MAMANRMARVAHVRTLQKRLALACQAQAISERDQLRQMAERIERLRQVYTPTQADAGGFSIKAMAHQYERLGKALASTAERETRAENALDAARAVALDAHRAKRAADELHARAEAAALLEAERRRERNAIPRRVIG